MSAVAGAELGPSLQYLMQSISLVQAGQPVGCVCSIISLGTVPHSKCFAPTSKSEQDIHFSLQSASRAEAGEHLWRSSLPALTHSNLLRAASCQVLNTPKDGHATTSLGNLCQCFSPLPVKTCLQIFKRNFLHFLPLGVLLSSLVHGHYRGNPGYSFISPIRCLSAWIKAP